MTTSGSTYPGGSKNRVSKAGQKVRLGTASSEDLAVIELWRTAHRPVLNTFQAILRNRTHHKDIVVAQRHKRKRTIFDKLNREPTMQLHRMDDVAGCRLIFDSIGSLYEFRTHFHSAKFNHKLKNEIDKYDYIKTPNPKTGYRGIHDIYQYDVNSEFGDKYKDLLIEIQYRTKAQHAWATCVEVIGFITKNQPKFKQGDARFIKILALSSEIIARVFEDSISCFPHLTNADLLAQFLSLDSEVKFINLLTDLNATDAGNSKKRNMILIFDSDRSLEIKTFRDSPDALRMLFKLENESPDKDVVLVRADTSEDIRIAFKNYFSDAGEFINLINEGCETLSGKKLNVLDKHGRRVK